MTSKAPIHPCAVLALAVLFPGAGHLAIGQVQTGLVFAFYALLLALFTWYLTTPEISVAGRTAGGLFVWALSIPDAYRTARLNFELWKRSER